MKHNTIYSIGNCILILAFLLSNNVISAQQMGINTESPDPQAILDVVSSNKGLKVPVVTTRPSGVNGLMLYYNGEFNFYENGSWRPRSYWGLSNSGHFLSGNDRAVAIGELSDATYFLHVKKPRDVLAMFDASGNTQTSIALRTSSKGLNFSIDDNGTYQVGNVSQTPNSNYMSIDDNNPGGQLSVRGQDGGIVPCGGIIMWNGNEHTIPDGWELCNGDNETPNLGSRFIQGHEVKVNTIGDTGGSNSASVTLSTANLPSHHHSAGSLTTSSSGAHSHEMGVRQVTALGCAGCAGEDAVDGSQDDNGVVTESAGAHTHTITGSTGNTGNGQSFTVPTVPKYYVLAYIMKTCE